MLHDGEYRTDDVSSPELDYSASNKSFQLLSSP